MYFRLYHIDSVYLCWFVHRIEYRSRRNNLIHLLRKRKARRKTKQGFARKQENQVAHLGLISRIKPNKIAPVTTLNTWVGERIPAQPRKGKKKRNTKWIAGIRLDVISEVRGSS